MKRLEKQNEDENKINGVCIIIYKNKNNKKEKKRKYTHYTLMHM